MDIIIQYAGILIKFLLMASLHSLILSLCSLMLSFNLVLLAQRLFQVCEMLLSQVSVQLVC